MAITDSVLKYMKAMVSVYNGRDGLTTWLTISGFVLPPIWQSNSLIQGEVFSVLAVQQLCFIWTKRCQLVSPLVFVSTYLDDAIIRAFFENISHLDKAWWEAIRIGNLANQPLNLDKCVAIASPGRATSYVKEHYADIHCSDIAVTLGVDVNFSKRRQSIADIQYPMYAIRYPISDIQYPISDILYLIADIPYPIADS